MALNKFCAIGASVIGLLIWTRLASAQAAAPSKVAQTKCEGTEAPGTDAPTPADPYPLNAAGWGPEVGNGLLSSRWAENWTIDDCHAAFAVSHFASAKDRFRPKAVIKYERDNSPRPGRIATTPIEPLELPTKAADIQLPKRLR